MDATCQCGLIKFTCNAPIPLKIYICHCTDCQHQSSSAFGISAVFKNFPCPPKVLQNVNVYVRTTAAGSKKQCYFCNRCGSRVVHSRVGSETLTVKGGCLIGDGGLTREMVMGRDERVKVEHIWTRSAIVDVPEGMKQREMEPSDEPGKIPEGME